MFSFVFTRLDFVYCSVVYLFVFFEFCHGIVSSFSTFGIFRLTCAPFFLTKKPPVYNSNYVKFSVISLLILYAKLRIVYRIRFLYCVNSSRKGMCHKFSFPFFHFFFQNKLHIKQCHLYKIIIKTTIQHSDKIVHTNRLITQLIWHQY